ncbi:MAG: nitrilase family protein, partial [Dysgonamonadaceae bacterium]|nr:nitrilase family protein [Dysgonamonadaceae bacterium]
GFFITPDGQQYFYDKKHLFRMGAENTYFTAGNKQLIVPYKGWNIKLIICYDLRFPVWIRNVDNAYDLLICCANWPESRKKVWDILLQARACENYCYVCGVNRTGIDGNGLKHHGGSLLVDPRGKKIINASLPQATIRTATIYKEPLESLRKKFPAWMDGDHFSLY